MLVLNNVLQTLLRIYLQRINNLFHCVVNSKAKHIKHKAHLPCFAGHVIMNKFISCVIAMKF